MTIGLGDTVPDIALRLVTDDAPSEIGAASFLAGRTVVLFAVPGAFTPTCSARHLPGFLDRAEALRRAGADEIACVAVNDPFVLKAWAESEGVGGRVAMLSDGSAAFARALGLEIDLSARGLGVRSRRYALIARDGVVCYLGVEPGTEVGVSGADAVLEALG